MSSSYNTEQELRRKSEEYSAAAMQLLEAADLLKLERETEGVKAELAELKKRVKDWLE